MTALATIAPARPLLAIICDLRIARSRLTSLQARCDGRDPTAVEDALWTELEARIERLEAERDAALEAMTGLSVEELREVIA